MRKPEVQELLGVPDYSAPNGQYMDYVLREWSPHSGMLNAVVWLHIKFNTDGTVESYSARSE